MLFTVDVLHLLHPLVKSVQSIMTSSCVKKPWKCFVLFSYPEIFFLFVHYPRSNKTCLASEVYLIWVFV